MFIYETGTNYKALTEKDLVFWIGVRLREVVIHGDSTVFVCAMSNFLDYNIVLICKLLLQKHFQLYYY